MSDFNYQQSGPEPKPDSTGTKSYMLVGIVLLVCSSAVPLIGADMAKGGMAMVANVLGGASQSNLWPIALVFWGNVFLYLGIGITLLAVLFDLLHRYRAAGRGT